MVLDLVESRQQRRRVWNGHPKIPKALTPLQIHGAQPVKTIENLLQVLQYLVENKFSWEDQQKLACTFRLLFAVTPQPSTERFTVGLLLSASSLSGADGLPVGDQDNTQTPR